MKHSDLMEVKAALRRAEPALPPCYCGGDPDAPCMRCDAEAALAKLESIEDPPRTLRDMVDQGRAVRRGKP